MHIKKQNFLIHLRCTVCSNLQKNKSSSTDNGLICNWPQATTTSQYIWHLKFLPTSLNLPYAAICKTSNRVEFI